LLTVALETPHLLAISLIETIVKTPLMCLTFVFNNNILRCPLKVNEYYRIVIFIRQHAQ